MATTPLSLEQFGQKIKTKHPEYSDMSDADVAQRVLAKYPQYGDMVGAKVTGTNANGQPIYGSDDAPKQSYWEALTNPVGAGGQQQGVLGGALQVSGQAIKTMAQPLVHPIDTAVGLYNTVRHPIDTATAMADKVKQDYQQGGVPLAAENVAGQVLGGVESGRVMAPVAEAAVNAVPKVVARGVLLGKTPEAAYESALKPSTTLSQADRAAVVKTGLQNAIPVSKSGLEKLGDRIDALNQSIKDQIAQDPNHPIDPNAVATRTAQTSQRFANQVVAQPDLNAIEATKQQFLAEQGATPGTAPKPTGLVDAQGRPIMTAGTPAQPAQPIGAADAQAMKQGTYSVLKGKFGEQGSATVEAQKALARGLKEEIAAQFPEIAKLNASESRLLDLQPVLERAVGRISNHQLIGIGTPVAGTAVKAVTGSGGAGAVASVFKAVLDNPAVKSRLAIALSKGAKIPYSQALSRVGAYSTALGSTAPDSQAYSSDGTPSQ